MTSTVLVSHTVTVLTGDPGITDLAYDPQLSRVRITASGLLDVARYRLDRSTDQTRWTTVRGGVDLAPSAGAVQLDDYEFTPDVPNHYRLLGPSIYDDFSRTVTGSWGTTPGGLTWVDGSAQQSVDGAMGVATHDAAGQTIAPTLQVAPMSDQAVEVTCRVPVLTSGATIDTGILLRRVSSGDYYLFNLIWQTDGKLRLDLIRQVSGSFTTLDSRVLSLTYTGAERVRLRAEAIGSTLRAKAWYAGGAPPSTWAVQAVDGSHRVGGLGVRSRRNGGNTNGTTSTYWDDLVVSPPEIVIFTDSITPVLDGVWLKSLARPFLNRRVEVRGFSPVTRRSRSGVFPVVGRSRPIAVTELHGSKQWVLELNARTPEEADALDLLISTGEVQFVHVPTTGRLSAVPGGYVALGDTTAETLPTLDLRLRVISLPLTEVAPPGADVVPALGTCQTVLNQFATCADVLAAFATCADLLQLVGSPADVIVD